MHHAVSQQFHRELAYFFSPVSEQTAPSYLAEHAHSDVAFQKFRLMQEGFYAFRVCEYGRQALFLQACQGVFYEVVLVDCAEEGHFDEYVA